MLNNKAPPNKNQKAPDARASGASLCSKLNKYLTDFKDHSLAY